MATSSSMEKELTCSVCLSLFSEPLVLQCMHSFCKKCLNEISQSSSPEDTHSRYQNRYNPYNQMTRIVNCPDCRYVTVLDHRGINGLPKNFTLANIVEKYSRNEKQAEKKILCNICDTKSPNYAVKYCMQCGILYCYSCLKQCHPRKGILASHEMVEPSQSPVARGEDPGSSFTKTTCVKEDRYCRDCSKSFSSGERSHRSHHVVTLMEQKTKIVENIRDHITRLEKVKREYTRKVKTAESAVSKANDDMKKISSQYKTTIDKVRALLNEKEKQANTRLQNEMLQKVDEREVQIDSVKHLVKDIDRRIQSIRQLLEQNLSGLAIKDIQDAEVGLKCLENRDVIVSDEVITLNGEAIDTSQVEAVVETAFEDKKKGIEDRVLELTSAIALPAIHSGAIEVKWTDSVADDKYKVSFIHQDEDSAEGNIVQRTGIKSNTCKVTNLQPHTTYEVQITSQNSHFMKPATAKVTTLPLVQCPGFVFDVLRANRVDIDPTDYSSMLFDDNSQESTNGSAFRNVFGTVGTAWLNNGQVYWEVIVQFNLNGRQIPFDVFAFQTGICFESKIDKVSPVGNNFHSYGISIAKTRPVKTATIGICREGNCIDEKSLQWANPFCTSFGFFLNFNAGEFSIIDLANNNIIITFENIKLGQYYVPFFTFGDPRTQCRFHLLTGNDITSLPSSIGNLITQ